MLASQNGLQARLRSSDPHPQVRRLGTEAKGAGWPGRPRIATIPNGMHMLQVRFRTGVPCNGLGPTALATNAEDPLAKLHRPVCQWRTSSSPCCRKSSLWSRWRCGGLAPDDLLQARGRRLFRHRMSELGTHPPPTTSLQAEALRNRAEERKEEMIRQLAHCEVGRRGSVGAANLRRARRLSRTLAVHDADGDQLSDEEGRQTSLSPGRGQTRARLRPLRRTRQVHDLRSQEPWHWPHCGKNFAAERDHHSKGAHQPKSSGRPMLRPATPALRCPRPQPPTREQKAARRSCCLTPETGAFAEFERDMIVQRINAGLDRARAKGVRPGRPPIDEKSERLSEMPLPRAAWASTRSPSCSRRLRTVARVKAAMDALHWRLQVGSAQQTHTCPCDSIALGRDSSQKASKRRANAVLRTRRGPVMLDSWQSAFIESRRAT